MNDIHTYPRWTVVFGAPGVLPEPVVAWLEQGAGVESVITPSGWRHSLIESATPTGVAA